MVQSISTNSTFIIFLWLLLCHYQMFNQDTATNPITHLYEQKVLLSQLSCFWHSSMCVQWVFGLASLSLFQFYILKYSQLRQNFSKRVIITQNHSYCPPDTNVIYEGSEQKDVSSNSLIFTLQDFSKTLILVVSKNPLYH